VSRPARSELSVVEAGPDRAADVLAVVRRAFGPRPALEPPSTALDESIGTVRAALAADGGLLVLRHDLPVGAVLFDAGVPGRLGLRRVSVDPAHQGHGVASALVGVAEDVAESRGLDGVWLWAREELPDTVEFWLRRGYDEVERTRPWIRLAKTLWLARALPSADDTRAFGRRLAAELAAGDLVVLTGGLGAGKTTLTKGIGAGLGVRGDVTSPTFVISRVHPSLSDGPELVHADAYRLGGAAELDDLDLDTSLPHAVTVVEWGEQMAERLGESWLEVRLDLFDEGGRAALAAAGADRDDPPSPVADSREVRVVSVRPRGRRWATVRLRSSLLR
jgi:tRNA threonylcarbamoyladenosine biosynthesis protein TsaE